MKNFKSRGFSLPLLSVGLIYCIATVNCLFDATPFQIPGYEQTTEPKDIYHWFGNTYLIFKDLRMNWMKSHLKCKSLGMEMMTLDSPAEFDSFSDNLIASQLLIDIARVQETNPRIAWIGVSDLFNENEFTNLYTGKPFIRYEFYNSKGKQPDKLNGGENCVDFILKNDVTPNYIYVNDDNCTMDAGVICKFRRNSCG